VPGGGIEDQARGQQSLPSGHDPRVPLPPVLLLVDGGDLGVAFMQGLVLGVSGDVRRAGDRPPAMDIVEIAPEQRRRPHGLRQVQPDPFEGDGVGRHDALGPVEDLHPVVLAQIECTITVTQAAA
jgi:hypothetical protein